MSQDARANAAHTAGARLRAVRTELGLNQTELARSIGVTQSSIAAYETDRRQPPVPVALALEHRFRVSHEWLLAGTGPRFAGALPPRPAILASEEDRRRLERLEGTDQYYVVPYLRDPAAAGSGLVMEEQIEGYCVIHRRVAPHPETIRCVRISGDSMAPTLTDGSIVAVDTTPIPMRALQGKVVCSRTAEGEVVIKRLRARGHYAMLFSDNEDQVRYPPVVVDLREVPEPIIGQVVWAWVDLR